MQLVALGLLGLVAASSEQQNLEALKIMFSIAEKSQIDRSDTALFEKLLPDMAYSYAPVMEYCGMNPGSPGGFEMKGVPFASCGKGFAQAYAGVKMRSMSAEFAVDPESNGQTILVWQRTQYQILSTNEVVNKIMAEKYKFNDEGLIVNIQQEFDTSNINLNDASKTNKYVAALKKMFKIAEESQHERLDKALLFAGVANFYAPIMEYCGTNPGSPAGFEMKGVPFASCAKGFAKAYASVKIMSWSSEFGVDPGSNRQTILVWQRTQYQIPSTKEVVNTTMAQRYKFNYQGLIVSMHEEFDPSKIVEAAKKNDNPPLGQLYNDIDDKNIAENSVWISYAIILTAAFLFGLISVVAVSVISARSHLRQQSRETLNMGLD